MERQVNTTTKKINTNLLRKTFNYNIFSDYKMQKNMLKYIDIGDTVSHSVFKFILKLILLNISKDVVMF